MQQGPPRPPQGPQQGPPRPQQEPPQGPPPPQGPFSSFMSTLSELPFWVREAIHYKLKDSVEGTANKTDIYNEMNKKVYQLIVPQLTFQGKKELQTKMHAMSNDAYKFMAQTGRGMNLAEITINNFWTLEKTSKILVDCFSKQFYSPLGDDQLLIIAAFLAAEIRFGEYLKRLGVTDLDQLESALRMQKEEDMKGQHIPIGQIFTKMGVIKEEDIKHVLMLKEDANKPVILRFGGIQGPDAADMTIKTLKVMNEKLLQENNGLKQQLTKYE